MTLFYIFAGLLIIQSLISLLQGFHYLKYFQQYKDTVQDFTPSVAIIAPCKGVDHSMDKFLQSLFEQNYPNYQIVFVVEDQLDLAFEQITDCQKKYPKIKSRCLIAGKSQSCGQKVHNLQVAVSTLGKEVAVFAFVDSDICLPSHWLKSLVSPLVNKDIGATTGYRWFIPDNFASLLRSIWNASIATSLGDHRNNFAWGGSMAILQETFESIGVENYWKTTISDDYALTKAIKDAKLYIKFIPLCMVASLGSCSFSEMLEFTTRQIIITKVYSPNLWKLLLFSNTIFNITFFIGLFLGAYLAITKFQYLPFLLTLTIYLLGLWKSYLRLKAIELVLSDYKNLISSYRWGYYLLSPLIALIFCYNLLISFITNQVTWRGITYKLQSDNHFVRVNSIDDI